MFPFCSSVCIEADITTFFVCVEFRATKFAKNKYEISLPHLVDFVKHHMVR